MRSLNRVIVIGGLTRDPELRHTHDGTAMAKFSLAMTEKFKGKDGIEKEHTCYVDVDAWGRLGENCAQYLRRGSQALVQGKLQMDQWEAKDGSKRSKLSVRATDVQFLSGRSASKPESPEPVPHQPKQESWEDDDGEVPF